jgi:hypothetical protein
MRVNGLMFGKGTTFNFDGKTKRNCECGKLIANNSNFIFM